jgi:hypothetical protein
MNKSSLWDPFRKSDMRRSALRIKPLVMKRCWRGMYMKKDDMKKNKNSNEFQHVENLDETLMPILPLDEDEVVHPSFPPAHKYEEAISLDDANDFMEDLSDMIYQHINDFI